MSCLGRGFAVNWVSDDFSSDTGAESGGEIGAETGGETGSVFACFVSTGGVLPNALSSPSSRISAIAVPTATPSVPSATRMLLITPSSSASTSIKALSVSISAITSPEDTVSPSFTSHRASFPSVIVGDKAGIFIIAIAYPLSF